MKKIGIDLTEIIIIIVIIIIIIIMIKKNVNWIIVKYSAKNDN